MISSFCRKMKFPPEASAVICGAYNKIKADSKLYGKFISAADTYANTASEDYRIKIDEISRELGISHYTVNIILVIYTMETYTKKLFAENGYSEQLYNDTMADTAEKLNECKKLYKVWGVFTLEWYRLLCKGRVFTHGRLQYELYNAPTDYKDIIKKGEPLLNCHIPGGSKLLDEDVEKSLMRAKLFFNKEPLILTCHSWMLYPPYEELYGKNMRTFYDRWEIVRLDESDADFWRIFYKESFEDVNEKELTSRLQKKMYSFIKNGGKMGAGLAYMVY